MWMIFYNSSTLKEDFVHKLRKEEGKRENSITRVEERPKIQENVLKFMNAA